MSKWYRKRRSYSKRSAPTPIALLILLAIALLYKYWQIALLLVIIVGTCALALYVIKRNKIKETERTIDGQDLSPTDCDNSSEKPLPTYSAKESIMTDCEKAFFKAFQEIVAPNYTVQPQINLASIIDKESHNRYRNELFRNIDFGIFDTNYSLMLLIEINDQSHTQRNRSARDSKVHAICEEAGIPLVTFWTKYGVNKQYISNRLSEHLPLITVSSNIVE